MTMGVDHVFCQEDFRAAINWINTNYGDSIFPKDRVVPRSNAAGNGNDGKCESLSESTRKRIEEFYSMDYCIFGYEKGGRGTHDSTATSLCPASKFKSKEEFTKRYAQCLKEVSTTQETNR